ncbi:imidazole glycerol phosphate synthase subunit HisH [Desulfobotulus mexicanus]|nr:imidazole glycerol phosphate synthase subunit HisH [Desulfobotulus mexicanus]
MWTTDRQPYSPKKRILIVSFGMGNLLSVSSALSHLGASFFVSSEGRDFPEADAFILPGVGAFGTAMENLQKQHLIAPLTREVMEKGKPCLGICLGMQLFAKDSCEMGFHRGLGWLDAHVLPLEPEGLPVPHVGWNDIRIHRKDPFFSTLDDGTNFYFDHSLHLLCSKEMVSAICDYGGPVIAAIQHKNLMAAQFHPEKSQRNGLKLLRNFLNFIEDKSPVETPSC